MELRIGLIGCGNIGRLRAEALRRAPPHRLVAVSDLDRGRAESLAARYGAAVESDWRTLSARSDLDSVIVSTPPSTHAQICEEALQNGKHVLCEKPLARNLDECRKLVAAAAKSGRVLATGFNYRFYPSMKMARALLDSGVIGELDHIRSYTGYSAAEHNHAWLHDRETMGGGALRDNGIHLIDVTRYFLGEVSKVQGLSSNSVWAFPGCEDNGFVLLESTQGKIAALHASWTEWRGYKFLVEIYGTKGCIRAWCFPMLTQVVWSDQRGGRTRSKWHLFPAVHLMEHLRGYEWVVTRSFVEELKALALAVEGKPSALATGWDGLRAVEIAQSAGADPKAPRGDSLQPEPGQAFPERSPEGLP